MSRLAPWRGPVTCQAPSRTAGGGSSAGLVRHDGQTEWHGAGRADGPGLEAISRQSSGTTACTDGGAMARLGSGHLAWLCSQLPPVVSWGVAG